MSTTIVSPHIFPQTTQSAANSIPITKADIARKNIDNAYRLFKNQQLSHGEYIMTIYENFTNIPGVQLKFKDE